MYQREKYVTDRTTVVRRDPHPCRIACPHPGRATSRTSSEPWTARTLSTDVNSTQTRPRRPAYFNFMAPHTVH